MGKKTVTREVSVCDSCGAEGYSETCAGMCGREFCYSCKKRSGKEFTHAVYFSGTGDIYVCGRCLPKLIMNPTPLFAAYQEIDNLKAEASALSVSFKARVDTAEAALKSAREKYAEPRP